MRLSDAEWTVMNALWQHAPATARDVQMAVQSRSNWAYTTVKTLLARLVDKNAVGVKMRGNASVYSPLVTRAAARKLAVHDLLDRAFDGAFGPLLHFLADDSALTDKDRKELTELLSKIKR